MGQSNASNGAKDIDAFNEGNLEGVNIKTHDNFGFGDMPAWYRENYLREREKELEKRKTKKKKKKNGK